MWAYQPAHSTTVDYDDWKEIGERCRLEKGKWSSTCTSIEMKLKLFLCSPHPDLNIFNTRWGYKRGFKIMNW